MYQSSCNFNLTVDAYVVNQNLQLDGNISIYPNPAKEQITIDCGYSFEIKRDLKLVITNFLNQTVYSTTINSQEITINSSILKGSGIYIVNIIDNRNNTVYAKKLVVL